MSLVMTASPATVRLDVDFGVAVRLHFFDLTEKVVDTEIHRVSSGLIELFSPIYFKSGQEVAVESEGRRLHARVAYCRRHVSGIYSIAIKTSGDFYLRTETRVPVDLVTRLQLLGAPTSLAIRVVDLSPSGLGIELSTPIPVGAKASVQIGQRTALGQVKHCNGKLHTYRAGLIIENLIRSNHASASLWADLNSGANNQAAVSAFIREIDERQSRAVALVASLSILRKA